MKKILSVLCVVISITLLCSIQLKKYNIVINSFRSPEIYGLNNTNIILIKPNQDNNVKKITSEKNIKSKLHAKASCLMDVSSGRILFSDNSEMKLPMASTTKIMTCILAIESGRTNEVVTISKYASTMPDVQLNIKEGEQYLLKDLLYSLMLESHNDTAVAIAEHLGGSVEGFAVMMNNKANELGCYNTSFVTPNGLDNDNHYTTAHDLCQITSYAICNDIFREIIATKSYVFSEISNSRTFTVNNHDSFLSSYDGAIGIKTGFTGKAGYCFAGAAVKNNVTLVTSVLGSGWPPHKTYKWSDTSSLMDYGFSNYNTVTILSGKYSSVSNHSTTPVNKLINLKPLSIHDENGNATSRIKKLNISFQADCSIPLSSSDSVSLALELPPYINAPIAEGEIVGTASLCLNNEEISEYPITADIEIPAISFKDITGIVLGLFSL